MTRCLSVATLGLLAFSAPAFAQDEADVASPEAVERQADSLRELFEAASRDGLVQLKDRPTVALDNLEPASKSSSPASKPVVKAPTQAADCMMLAPLFDGGQGGFEDGIFVELAVDMPETVPLAKTLSALIDPGYAGAPLDVDLRSAGNCGSSFLPWQALADPARQLDAETEAKLTSALNDMKPALRRQLGVQIATRAGLNDNLRLARRIADTLSDAGLHNRPHHNADVEHVLLDALLKMDRDPVGARSRLSWIAERDGPEQLSAIDLLHQLDATYESRAELKRLTESPDIALRDTAHQKLLARAIDKRDMGRLNTLISEADTLSGDPESVRQLSVTLAEAILSDDPLTAIHALDLYKRLDANGVDFDQGLRASATARLDALVSKPDSEPGEIFASPLETTPVPDDLSGPSLDGYVDALSQDLERYKEVLRRG